MSISKLVANKKGHLLLQTGICCRGPLPTTVRVVALAENGAVATRSAVGAGAVRERTCSRAIVSRGHDAVGLARAGGQRRSIPRRPLALPRGAAVRRRLVRVSAGKSALRRDLFLVSVFTRGEKFQGNPVASKGSPMTSNCVWSAWISSVNCVYVSWVPVTCLFARPTRRSLL